MDYQYDVFFSYKRDPETDAWHEKVKTKLAFWLRQELERQDVRIFFDTEEIQTGTRWRHKLAEALRQSRCIVCVWSPLYFRSKWCVSEWMTFVRREDLAKRELVASASFCDGKSFPKAALDTTWVDFSEFASTFPTFWNTEPAVTFEKDRLRPFASALAAKIRNAPPFDGTFPLVEVPDDQVAPEGTIGRLVNV